MAFWGHAGCDWGDRTAGAGGVGSGVGGSGMSDSCIFGAGGEGGDGVTSGARAPTVAALYTHSRWGQIISCLHGRRSRKVYF